jgi:HK97 family phage major capsid protein
VQNTSNEDEQTFKRFSLVKFLRDAASPSGLKGVEMEMHQEAEIEAQHNKLEIRNFGIPAALLRKPAERRDMTAGTAGQGGNTVATELRGFIDALRSKLILARMGANFMGGLIGDVKIPRQITKSTPTEAAENGTAGEESITFDQVSLSPNRLPATSDISKQLLIQSSQDVERLVINDLISEMRRRIDAMGINGSGSSNEPTGILQTTGIGDVAGGTNGLAPTRANLINIKKEVAIDDAEMSRVGFITNEDAKAKLQTTAVDSGSGLFVWPDVGGTLVGYNAETSSLVPNDLTKGSSSGVCSAIIFGNFEDLIVAQWGGLDILVDPYSKSASGLVVITADTYYDVAVRHAESFSAMQDALTA